MSQTIENTKEKIYKEIKLNFTEAICDNLNDVKLNETESEELIEVQKVVADYERTLQIC